MKYLNMTCLNNLIFVKTFDKRYKSVIPAICAIFVLILAILIDIQVVEWIAVGSAAIFGFIAIKFNELSEFAFKGGPLELSAKLKQAENDARMAKELATLSVELACAVTLVPTGRADGGAWNQFDEVYKLALTRLNSLGFSLVEANTVLKAIEPVMAKRIYLAFVSKKLEKSGQDVNIAKDHRIFRKISKGIIMTPAEIETMIDENHVDSQVREEAVFEYKKWYESKTRITTALNLLNERSDSA